METKVAPKPPVPEWLATALSSPAHSPPIAWLTSVASAWAYSDERTLSRVLRLCIGSVDVTPISCTNGALLVDTQAFVVRSEALGLGMLVFRGTQFGAADFTDILTDIAVAPAEFLPGTEDAMVHGGFYRSLAPIWHELLDALEGLLELPRFIVTGHSLGGALAVLASAMLFSDLDRELEKEGAPEIARRALNPDGRNVRVGDALWPRLGGVYTFGQPMVGNEAFVRVATDLQPLTFRHVYRKDWVPTLPPRSTGKFRHFGLQYENGAHGWKSSPSVTPTWSAALSAGPAVLAFVAQQFALGRRIPFPYSLADHLPSNYVTTSKQGVAQAPWLFP